jgi:putative component of membrane protein insertase Oxa1/YidC/SpoIIIJ protein YidD
MFVILIYQAIIPCRLRGVCLFKESCSNFVYRQTKNKGFYIGTKALIFRFKNCRANYYLLENNGQILLVTKENKVFEEKDLDERILFTYRSQIEAAHK